MSYNNYGGGAPRSYFAPRQGGNYRPYNRGAQGTGKKRSGCKNGFANADQSAPYVRGWNASRRNGFTTIIAGPYKNTKKVTSKTGRVWENWCAKVQNGRQAPYLVSCLFDVSSGRVIINQLGMVMNPRTNYCGTFTKRKKLTRHWPRKALPTPTKMRLYSIYVGRSYIIETVAANTNAAVKWARKTFPNWNVKFIAKPV